MKTRTFLFIAAIGALSLVSCRTGYTVRERPPEVVYRRPVAPAGNQVWVSGDWVWRGGRYVRQEGYWTAARPGYRYVDGYWQHSRGGQKWRSGYWKRY